MLLLLHVTIVANNVGYFCLCFSLAETYEDNSTSAAMSMHKCYGHLKYSLKCMADLY